jgi:hypothetical protein
MIKGERKVVMQDQSAKQSRIRWPAGLGRPRLLLIEVANMGDDRVTRFRRKCRGWTHCEAEEVLRLRDELRLLWPGRSIDIGDKETGPVFVQELTVSSRSAWAMDVQEEYDYLGLEEIICGAWLGRFGSPLAIDRTRMHGLIRMALWSLPNAVAVAYSAYCEMLRYCGNPDCAAPYFIAKRKDQRYCGEECASPAKKDAKLRYWHRTKGKTRADGCVGTADSIRIRPADSWDLQTVTALRLG